MAAVSWNPAGSGEIYFQEESDKKRNSTTFITLIKSKEDGYGTRAIGTLVASISCASSLHLTAGQSSHIFFLKMGFIPNEKKIRWLDCHFGAKGRKAVDDFFQLHPNMKKRTAFTAKEQKARDNIKTIIACYRGIETINEGEMQKKKCIRELRKIKKAQVSYITHLFVPALIDLINKSPSEHRPDSKALGPVDMTLSKEGLKRWHKAQQAGTAFVPFRRFEQLMPQLTKEDAMFFRESSAAVFKEP